MIKLPFWLQPLVIACITVLIGILSSWLITAFYAKETVTAISLLAFVVFLTGIQVILIINEKRKELAVLKINRDLEFKLIEIKRDNKVKDQLARNAVKNIIKAGELQEKYLDAADIDKFMELGEAINRYHPSFRGDKNYDS